MGKVIGLGQLDVKMLENIIKTTADAVEESKTQIFDIYEAAHIEMEYVSREADNARQEALTMICRVDELAVQERRARLRLKEAYRNLECFSEADMQQVYSDAENLRVELEVAREREAHLRRRRDELELRLRSLKKTAGQAEVLAEQVGLALGFLNGQMGVALQSIENLQQRQLFAAKVIGAQEEERRRLARDIHDGPAQSLANIMFRIEVCERLMDCDLHKAKEELSDLRQQVHMGLKDTRRLIFGLRPSSLDDLGLLPTIRRLLSGLEERTSITCSLYVTGQERRLAPHLEVALFRVIQEGLANIERHSQAGSVQLNIDFGKHSVVFLLEDDGRGFDISFLTETDRFGISGMKERISLIGGEIKVSSQPGKGTKIYIEVKL